MLKPKAIGFHPKPRPYRVPAAAPSSLQVLRAALKRRLADGPLGRVARMAVERNIYLVGGNAAKCVLDPTATLANVVINATSGVVVVGRHVFFGHGVQLLAGTHDATLIGDARKRAIPTDGYDITIEHGAWLASNVTIVGPCVVGANAVVCAGAVVLSDVPPNTMVAGIPAKIIKTLNFGE